MKYNGGIILGADSRSSNVSLRSQLYEQLPLTKKIWPLTFSRVCTLLTVFLINSSQSTTESTARGLEHLPTLRQSPSMWDTTSMCSLMSLEVFLMLSLQLPSWDRSSTRTKPVSRQVWSAQAGTLIKAIRSTVWTRLASIKRETGPFQDLEALSFGATLMPITTLTWTLNRPKNSSTLPSHLLATVMEVQVVSSEW